MAISLASVNGTSMQATSSGLPPAKAIQNDKATLARRKPIQTNEASSVTRRDRVERIEALRVAIRELVVDISQETNAEAIAKACTTAKSALVRRSLWSTGDNRE
ncbi:TPA: hypothetical protein QDB46_005321 [Burkholderia multivorans]|nr:hypothetical protein [Burkholderia multivorans]HDR9295795.1 hypothetical protein [Burkholderia multivorans]HDR9301679.1 hypothetical protein [Burkholderia multivorans]HDR9307293.1 hypothetical protein [Burkholderia multivorans]HDR9313094.1 hypothetical protein [Burkholderia multivorans]